MTDDFAGKVVLVTGASKGIGAGIATAFAAAGARVGVGLARDQEGADRVVSQIEAAGGQAVAVRADLSRTAAVDAMIGVVTVTFGPIDTLVNNGAVFEFKPLPGIDDDHFHYSFDTNVLGLLTATRMALSHFNPEGGSIVNISSLSAMGHTPNSAVYSASKAAVNAITKVLALELADRKIRVNCIMPGYVDTEGSRSIGVKGSDQEAHLIANTPLEKRRSSDRPRSGGGLSGLSSLRLDHRRDPHGLWRASLNG